MTTGQHDSVWSKQQPYPAKVLQQRLLTATDATKQVMHVEVDLGDSGLRYLAGDTLGCRIENDPLLVAEILDCCGLPAEPQLQTTLRTHHEITQVHPGFFKHYAKVCSAPALQALVADPPRLRSYMEHRQIIDVLREFPATLTGEQLLGCLRLLQDRQYSIASSQRSSPTTAALTVGLLRYEVDKQTRFGAGSSFLSRLRATGAPLPVYVVTNQNFRLPADPATPIIMIGPGTGIAPFRSFLQERFASGASGMHWLFAGNRRQNEDFLYGEELNAWHSSGALQRFDVAFSREGTEKHYVQHLLLQHADTVFKWLQDGAHLYVCGDAKHMAEDVQRTLLAIIEQAGKLDAIGARAYLVGLRQQQRYQRDVY